MISHAARLLYAKSPENKTLAKIFGFTVSNVTTGLNFCPSLHRHAYFVYANSKCSMNSEFERLRICADLPDPRLVDNAISVPYSHVLACLKNVV